MWDELERSLDQEGRQVEYGVFQINRIQRAPSWRTHRTLRSNFRFRKLRNALFSLDDGAWAACMGTARRPLELSMTRSAIVPFVATWLSGDERAYLIRRRLDSRDPDPDITIIDASAAEDIRPIDDAILENQLGRFFAEGDRRYGVRRLGSDRIYEE